jgi:hypothetical protein
VPLIIIIIIIIIIIQYNFATYDHIFFKCLAFAQAGRGWLLTAGTRLYLGVFKARFVLVRMALEQVFVRFRRFSLLIIIPSLLPTLGPDFRGFVLEPARGCHCHGGGLVCVF